MFEWIVVISVWTVAMTVMIKCANALENKDE